MASECVSYDKAKLVGDIVLLVDKLLISSASLICFFNSICSFCLSKSKYHGSKIPYSSLAVGRFNGFASKHLLIKCTINWGTLILNVGLNPRQIFNAKFLSWHTS